LRFLLDDLTGGAAVEAAQLSRKLGAEAVAACLVIDLPGPSGAKKLALARRRAR